MEEIDLDIDRGLGNEELVNSRLAIIHQIQKIDNLESKERAQKAKIKWAVEGNENSGFFHGIINKRRNIQNIRGVMVDGNWIENPNDVKKEFFDHFANRFGKPDKPTASISLDFPNQISHEQSDHMEREVSNDEIKKSVWECGTDKAPGPDGFTFGFFRHFWHLVDRDVCEAVRYFFKFSDLPKGCNSSFIALIPKIPDANLVKDFRPISLIGSIYKIIAKILTNRLVDVLGGIINEVQSAFIKDRQILDGPFILNEVMSWCKKKKKQTLLFKVDFEKAYDSVRWDFLDDVLGKFGFGDKWRKWIQCCLHSSKGSIIINGSPTDEFQFGRGLKQGDPLSPFLFLLIMESLHISFQRVVDAGMFHGIDVGGLVNLSHMFYADDAVFIGEWSESNITSLIHVLDCFHKVSGLKINMCKSKIMGIEVDNGKVSRAATKFGCLVLKAPFLYLGSYVGGDMNKIQSWKDIIDRIRRRLSRWKMKMLSIGGRLMLIKSVLGSMPIFHMSMFKVPAGVIQILESLRSKFFNGHESSGKKASWVQWKKALAPKDNGGLGIFSLYALNRGLIFKWVWRFLAHEPTLWSRVIKAIHGANGKIDEISGKGANSCWINIIKEVRRLEEKGINLLLFMKKKLGNGLSTLFWDDVWCDGGKLKNRFPRAYALENSKQITVGQKLAHPSLYHSFRRHPRGGLELTQVEELAKVINPVVLTQSPDSWSWTLNNSGGYTVASSRNMIDSRLLPKGDLKTRWIRYVPNKVNTFAWKVMTNSLPTRFNISRRGIDIESLSCVNCDVGIETNDHLFFACNTAKKISKLINRWWDVPFMDINSYGEWRSWIDNVKLPKKNKSMFQVLITGVGIDAILCLAGTIAIHLSNLLVDQSVVNQVSIQLLLIAKSSGIELNPYVKQAIHGANGKIDEISGKGANSCWINIIKEVRRLEEKGINLLLFMKKKLGNGLSTLFWDDVWCDEGKLKNRFPRAYALENNKQITVGQKLAHPSLYHSFRRHPRGGLELTQVEELAKVINPVVLTQSPDSWSWTLNNSGGYTVASSRNMIDSRLLPKGDLKTRWIRYVPNKVNTFAWKVMTNSLPTRFNISRRGIDIESLSCVNCDVGIETNDHLFFACNTAKKISKLINRWWDVPFMDINSYGEWRSWIDNVKLPKKNKSMFQ
ncbi:RNA-directed DNA polymerase, eukaryota, partial [Tanacetum coccineum]